MISGLHPLGWMLLAAACNTADGGRGSGDASEGTGVLEGSGTAHGTDDSGSSGASGTSTTSSDGTSAADTGTTTGDDDTGTGNPGTTGVSTTADTSSSSGTDDGDVVPCDVLNPEVTYVPPNVMFVLDKSGSMTSNSWNHDNDPNTPNITRWATLHQVVSMIVNQYESQVKFGAKLYPTNTGCGTSANMEVPLALNNAAAIIAGIPPESTSISNTALTPPQQGVETTRNYLNQVVPDEPRAMLVVMDGQVHSSCGTQQGFINALSSIYNNDGIPVYMVGIDISGALVNAMNDYAEAGGVPKQGNEKFYNSSNGIELQQAMEDIIESVLSCSVTLNPEPAFPDLTKVILGGMELSQVTDCDTEDGWVWETQYSEIRLCGAACAEFKTLQNVEIEFYCDPG